MIFAEKVMLQRKKNGWSQEELAEKMGVSRQAVGKWETSQSVPDLAKILQLAELFGVTTDYLLKDDMEEEEFAEGAESTPSRRVTLAEANEYLALRVRAAKRIAIGVLLCILSPIALILLTGMAGCGIMALNLNIISAIGVVTLLLLVATAVLLFVRTGFENAPYEFLDKESFETEYGVAGMVKEKQKAFHDTYVRYNYIGVCLCVLSPAPLLLGSFTEKEMFVLFMLALTLIAVAIGVMFFVLAGVRWGSFQRLLCEGDFTKEKKAEEKRHEAISTVYWLIATAGYLLWSFLSNDWDITWVVWPIAGILFPIALIIYDAVTKKKS